MLLPWPAHELGTELPGRGHSDGGDVPLFDEKV